MAAVVLFFGFRLARVDFAYSFVCRGTVLDFPCNGAAGRLVSGCSWSGLQLCGVLCSLIRRLIPWNSGVTEEPLDGDVTLVLADKVLHSAGVGVVVVQRLAN